ncbi:hypothetical protein PVA17_23725 [Lysinibacillus sp. CNPSo 3705]|uniref:hypothetical protein n=1 Tax=Lysinibacillus sp. CNPSo 3705 TaxID=3028148 RepID=UPI00236492EB|nr:hypothetical protein [Lysinibacillus sp. CNPSo 3705]MDD1505733.1 hypothetical protein [Lysinibacillus sp. CNPSo 3705]
MNLRQKIKQAKKELRELEKTAISNRNYRYFKRQKELSDFINTKRQLNSYTNDEKILKGKITYMELSCGIRKLCIIKHANGKPLSHKQQIHFNNKATKALLNFVPVVYKKYKNNKELPSRFYSIYTLYVSTDRTKLKRLFCKLFIYQFINSQSLFIKKEEEWIKIVDND